MAGEDFDSAFWEESYRTGNIPWNSEQPNRELVRLVENRIITPCKVLDIGCGTGTNSIWLAINGFSALGIDISTKAVEIAGEKSLKAESNARFLTMNAMELSSLGDKFDLAIDMGCYHSGAFQGELSHKYANLVHNILKEDGRFFLACFSPKEPPWGGPRRISLTELEKVFTPYFDFTEIRHTQWRAVDEREGPWSWWCLLQCKV